MSVKVLVADDSATMRKIIIRALAGAGVTDVVEAPDGSEAVARFEEGGFDLVLTDWNMPGKTGLDVLKAIRGSGSKTPVILITTEGEKSRVLEAVQNGVSDYVVKPFDAAVLQGKLEKHLGSIANA